MPPTVLNDVDDLQPELSHCPVSLWNSRAKVGPGVRLEFGAESGRCPRILTKTRVHSRSKVHPNYKARQFRVGLFRVGLLREGTAS